MRILLAIVLVAAGLAVAIAIALRDRPSPTNPPTPGDGATVDPTGIVLRDVAREAGVTLRNACGDREKKWIIEANGSGAGLLDYDLDGDLDIYIVNGSTLEILEGNAPPVRNALYRNDGGWRFADVTGEAGVGDPSWGYGCAIGDIDGDGDPDIYVTNWGPNVLYRNDGDGTFSEIGVAAGVADDRWGESAAFGDLDRDGDLDLYVTNYVLFDPADPPNRGELCRNGSIFTMCGPRGLPAQADVLYRNDGEGRFTDVSEESGILAPEPQFGLGVLIADITADGRSDIYVANDSVPNFLFRNEGGTSFVEVASESGLAVSYPGQPQAGMGVTLGDFDGDDRPDLFVTNFSQDYNTLYWNTGDGTFMDTTEGASMANQSWQQLGWGTALADFDNDADQDIFIANGHVWPQVDGSDMKLDYRQPDQLFLNAGGGSFRDESGRIRIDGDVRSSRGAAFGDIDDDGDIDVVVVPLDDIPHLLDNRGGNRGAWLQVRLIGATSNREGLGAQVRVTVGDQTQSREALRGGSYCSSSDPRVHFGLGEASRVDRLEVRWPSGTTQTFTDVASRQRVVIHETDGLSAETRGAPGGGR